MVAATLSLVLAMIATPVTAHTITWNPSTYTTPITDWADPRYRCAVVTTWFGGHGDPAQHWAIDIAIPDWTPIYSPKGGYAWYELNQGGGHMVRMTHAESGGTFLTTLAHLSAYNSNTVGSSYANRRWVNKNVIVGWSGHSGQLVTGAHLHWSMHVSDHTNDKNYGANLDLIPGVKGNLNPKRVCGVE
jgi:murein DD-endopeptidase MepM/ murein hydrolase activator NlpD